jgi:predicted transcriptional regulator
MLTKTKLKEQIEKFPEEFSIEDLIERLIVVEKIEKGIEQSKAGLVVSEGELGKEIEKWFK